MKKFVFILSLLISSLTAGVVYAIPTQTPTPSAASTYTTRNIQFNPVLVTSAGGTATVSLSGLFTITPTTYVVITSLAGGGNANAVYTTVVKSSGSFIVTVRDKNGAVVNCSVTNQTVHWSAFRAS